MHLRIKLLLLSTLLFFTSVHGQDFDDMFVPMSDGIQLDALVAKPSTPVPASGYPAILLVHGFGGSKNNVRTLAGSFASQGYVSVGYSVRGQGNSQGLFDFFTSPRILGDLREMISFTATLEHVNADRIGVIGASQGGLHAWNAAAYNMPVRAVVSVIANGRARENWLENNALNWIFSNATLTSGVRFEPSVRDSLLLARNGEYDIAYGFLTRYSTNNLEMDVEIPTAIVVSTHDIFFNQNAAVRQFANIQGPGRFILYPGEHDLPAAPQQESYVLDFVDRWFSWWLKDDTAHELVASSDSAVVCFDGGTGAMRVFTREQEDFWFTPNSSNPGLREVVLYFRDIGLSEHPSVNSGVSTVQYFNFLGSTPAVFRSEAFKTDLVIAALSPIASLYCSGSSQSYQMNVSLFDLDEITNTRIPIARGHMQVDAHNGQINLLQFELTRTLHTIRAGRVLEAQIHGGIALFPDLNVNFGNIVLPPSVNSINTLAWGGDTPSALRLYTLVVQPTWASTVKERSRLTLHPNYPNPFNPSTTLSFTLPSTAHVRLRVFSPTGAEIALLYDGMLEAGGHSMSFNAGTLPSGVYFCVLESDGNIVQRPMLLLR